MGFKKSIIDLEIDRLIIILGTLSPDNEQYQTVVNNLEVLYRSRSYKSKWAFEGDTVLTAASSLLSILLIMNHERLAVLSTKALGFVMKAKVL